MFTPVFSPTYNFYEKVLIPYNIKLRRFTSRTPELIVRPFFCLIQDQETGIVFDFVYNNITKHRKLIGFETSEQVEEAKNKISLKDISNEDLDVVYSVNKEYDMPGLGMTGNKIMVMDKLFRNPIKAHDYILDKPGINGEEQRQEVLIDVSVQNELSGSIMYSGYSLTKINY